MLGATKMKRAVVYAGRVSRLVRRTTRPSRRIDALAPCRSSDVRFAASERGGGLPRGLNTSNPFEVKFHTDDGTPQAELSAVSTDMGTFEDEIDLFHSEMVDVFGSEPEEYRDDGTQPAKAQSSTDYSSSVEVTSAQVQSQSDLLPPLRGQEIESPPPTRPRPQSAGSASIVLIHGPCTYVHDGWIGSKDRWSPKEVASMVNRIAQTHGLSISQHHSNHEGQILDWLLNTSPGDKIVLNWNGRLADSPTVYRALASIRAFVVILAPLDVELGPLPPSVKGVIAGFGTRSLDLAIQACK